MKKVVLYITLDAYIVKILILISVKRGPKNYFFKSILSGPF
jgi:hypothetical protein